MEREGKGRKGNRALPSPAVPLDATGPLSLVTTKIVTSTRNLTEQDAQLSQRLRCMVR